ncbi:hypothetical protein HPB48_002018 [Haemaphysalis longicornis]|uniref:Acetyl-coenzyme A synthetase N-terminal domain-containing protein n=1 Tax=Haemaphysalis longicornis TaxID=44386 RepID=A0A9J6FLL0_HAELO|nr:hypothetical protein HPB48_002018 [Haemaphysalis longicornis]
MCAAANKTRSMTNDAPSTPAVANGTAAQELFQPPRRVQEKAYVRSMGEYEDMYQRSLKDPEGFWKAVAQDFYFKQPPRPGKFLDYNIDVRKGPVYVRFMEGAKTNISYNLLGPKHRARPGRYRRLLLVSGTCTAAARAATLSVSPDRSLPFPQERQSLSRRCINSSHCSRPTCPTCDALHVRIGFLACESRNRYTLTFGGRVH